MKTLKFLIFAVLAVSMGMACSVDTPKQGIDNSEKQDLLKSKLLGEWVLSDQKCSYVYAFVDNDTVYTKTTEGKTIEKWPYQPITADSIRITWNNWTTHNKVVFYSNDSIRINDFIPSDAAVYPPEFSDAVLIRFIATPPTEEKPDNTLPACTTRTDDVTRYLTDYRTTILKEYAQDRSLSSHIVIAKQFDDTEPTAYLIESFDSGFRICYRICNYPRYAKEWDIPENGLPVLLSGKVYPPSFNPGFQPDNTAFFDLELTMLKSEEPETGCKWEQVTPVTPSNEQKNRLDYVFSGSNQLLGNIRSDTLIVVNNREDMVKLQGFSEYPDMWMEFEWDNQCIIGGKIVRPHGPNKIISQQLFMCPDTSSYKYEIDVKGSTPHYDAEECLYFWAIYSKKMNSEEVSFIVKIVE